MYVYMYVCMYVHTHMCMHVGTNLCTYANYICMSNYKNKTIFKTKNHVEISKPKKYIPTYVYTYIHNLHMYITCIHTYVNKYVYM